VASDILPGGVVMGRSFESLRMGIKDVSARWLKASRAFKKEEDRIYGEKLAEMAKKLSSEAFYAVDDPLEAAAFYALVEMLFIRIFGLLNYPIKDIKELF
jgi:hypothetical protein